MSYKKVGGLHHFKLGRFGMSFYKASSKTNKVKAREFLRLNRQRIHLMGVNAVEAALFG